ncbi:MAG: sulfite exporter TauE/SafE family protein [Chitinophagales bacterium]|nr:sulfite exporter TauE/SafE family protein [Chitinophagales bacterium]
MEIWQILLLILVGFVAGVINVMAGGGSLLTMPLLIFMGLDSAMANGSNRIAILFQNATAIAGFKSKKHSAGSYGLILGLSALLGAILGSKIALEIPDGLFNKILAAVMILVVIMTIVNPALKLKEGEELVEKLDFKHKVLGAIALFFTGIYGGFIQAGTGLFIMAALSFINRYNLLKANVAKALIMFIYTLSALMIFALDGKIHLLFGLSLAISMSAGAWWASRWSTGKGQKYIKWFMIVSVIFMAIALWFKS